MQLFYLCLSGNKKEQHKLSKRKEGSKNRERQRRKVAKLHEKVANQRKDFLHKLSRQITNAYDAVVIENLNMRVMAQGLKLAKSTNANGFGMLKAFLGYKLVRSWSQSINGIHRASFADSAIMRIKS